MILGDLLARNYFIDPSVNGRVTLQTSRPLAHEDLVPTLETLLRTNGAAVVLNRDVYHVVPREGAVRGLITPQLGDSDAPLPDRVRRACMPVRYVSAREMAEILDPFAPVDSVVRVDTTRNLLVLAGSAAELSALVDTVGIFDVDWLKGLSFGLFTPEYVDAAILAKELAGIFGEEGRGPLAGLVRIVPIDHLQSLLVVSPRREYMERVAAWIERLDRPRRTVGQRLFVYRVRNGRASDLAGLLEQVVEPRAGDGDLSLAMLAPGLEPVEIRTATGEEEEPGAPPRVSDRRPSPSRDGLLTGGGAAIRVIADDTNNSLLILANAGGLVVMEVEQEVSDVAPDSTGSLTPTIQQRRISSTVAVQSGETVVLGGLIRENKNRTESGVPGLSRIPVLGWLFGSDVDSARRTELVVLITPRAVRDSGVARRITEEFRRKMKGLKPFRTEPVTESPPEALPGATAQAPAPD